MNGYYLITGITQFAPVEIREIRAIEPPKTIGFFRRAFTGIPGKAHSLIGVSRHRRPAQVMIKMGHRISLYLGTLTFLEIKLLN